jgi:hypothetical protein
MGCAPLQDNLFACYAQENAVVLQQDDPLAGEGDIADKHSGRSPSTT